MTDWLRETYPVSWNTSGIAAPVLDFMASRMLRRYGALYDKRVSEMLAAGKGDVTPTRV